jgi:hypothetical protein
MAIKNVPLCDDVQNTSRSFFGQHFSAMKFLVSRVGCRLCCETRREEKKVGRVVSLSIDLQDISELDRDAVIASCEKKRSFLFMSRVALRVRHSGRAQLPRNFLIRCISMQVQAMQEKRVSSLLLSSTAVWLAFTYLTEGL